MKILYICPDFPFPADTGGKRVFISNINKMLSLGAKIDFVFFNNSFASESDTKLSLSTLSKHENCNSINIISRNAAKFNDAYSLQTIKSLFMSFFSYLPRAWFVRSSRILSPVKNVIDNADKIIVDHAAAFGILPRNKWLDKRVVYISHNIESKIIKEIVKQEKSIIKKAIWSIDFYKTVFCEKKLLKLVEHVMFISDNDLLEAASFTNNSHGRYSYYPFTLPLREEVWTPKPLMFSHPSALFVGGSNYFPNFDAAKWLIEKFAVTNPHIVVNIVGNNAEIHDYFHKNLPENVVLHGRVSDAELDEIYKNSTFFISPIVYGSGIKIKVLEAASYGMPIFSTKESLLGLSFLDDCCYMINRNESCDADKSGLIFGDDLLSEEILSKMSSCTINSLSGAGSEVINI